MGSDWLQEDLCQLQGDELERQLEVIFGKDKASQFINPTIEDKPQNTTLSTFKKKYGHLGAHALWHSMRKNSMKRLSQNTQNLTDSKIQSIPKNDGTLKNIEVYKHKFELMYRIAHLNEEKTKQCLDLVKLPMITGELLMDVGPDKYLIPSQHEKVDRHLSLPSLKTQQSVSFAEEGETTFKSKSNQALCFLSEGDCTSPGMFQERMQLLGVDSSIGISKPDQNYILHNTTNSQPVIPLKTFERTEKRTKQKQKTKSHKWQPLTLSALVEYTKVIPAPGKGQFRSGKAMVWKPT